MGLSLRPGFLRRGSDEITPTTDDTPVAVNTTANADKDGTTIPLDDALKADQEVPSEDAQNGVRDIEAVTLAWTKKSLISVLISVWFVYLLNAFQSSTAGNLVPYVTSDWGEHSLMTVVDVVASSMTAAVFIPLAKFLDLWGRAEGFLVMAAFSELGLILMATSKNLSTYCAANVFYSVGFTGLIYSIDVVTADATNLRNRALAYAFTSSPYMISAFAGSYASESMLYDIGWGWGFATYAFILPLVCAPLYILLKVNLRKAKAFHVIEKEPSGRTLKQNIWFYLIEFDALGVFLFASGLIIFLLPFNIASSAPNGWATGYIIAMIVVGFVLLVGFGVNELWLAPVPFLKFQFLTDRTLVGACLLDLTYMISYYCWNAYFTSFLQVVNYLSVAEAGYVNNTFSVVSGFLLFLVGWSIRKTGYFKWLLWVSVPLYILAQGLMIYFRNPTGYIGYIVMTQIFIAIGGSVFILCMQLAVLAAVDHQHVAAALAMLNVTGTVGGSVGYTISGAIWTNVFENALIKYLPNVSLDDIASIYGDLDVQLSYPKGSDERIGIQKAYGYAQTRMLAAGTAIMVLSFIWVALIRNLNVSKLKQTKGNVF
ncbi:putative mfs siderochrome iron transporter protein [Phaeoacremonium minimum UCRPA7]|uniref:Putative mfs siderochrome iron transporter protein n=1 Tax=Phaeoacremonium minimum (strain UCR-PA7) TaxID=1286976 RepID=R8BHQ2_PHAM7|nr:putative mfs siderochrome iron transporter protein [Phaeoacremonium minimum UCRPA7]EON98860.1 putative mfs siderochrome iron transporter protein [Phaeoacremonium minimum UCRPA7]